MSVREEDEEQQKGCSSHSLGLGMAVAAIGVGVGAAFYYLMKRPANPNTAGSTTQDWTCEPEHALDEGEEIQQSAENSYTTISEHTTTDTSMNDSMNDSTTGSATGSATGSTTGSNDNNSSHDNNTSVTENGSNSTDTDSRPDDSAGEIYLDNNLSDSVINIMERVDTLESSIRDIMSVIQARNLGSVSSIISNDSDSDFSIWDRVEALERTTRYLRRGIETGSIVTLTPKNRNDYTQLRREEAL